MFDRSLQYHLFSFWDGSYYFRCSFFFIINFFQIEDTFSYRIKTYYFQLNSLFFRIMRDWELLSNEEELNFMKMYMNQNKFNAYVVLSKHLHICANNNYHYDIANILIFGLLQFPFTSMLFQYCYRVYSKSFYIFWVHWTIMN